MSDGAFPDRLTQLRNRWEADPSSRVFLQLAEEYRHQGRVKEALAVLDRGLKEHPGYLSALVAKGRCHLELGEPEAARGVLERVVKQDATQMVANKLLVRAYLDTGEPEKARERLDLYSLLNDSDPEIEELRRRLRAMEQPPQATPTSDRRFPEAPPPAGRRLRSRLRRPRPRRRGTAPTISSSWTCPRPGRRPPRRSPADAGRSGAAPAAPAADASRGARGRGRPLPRPRLAGPLEPLSPVARRRGALRLRGAGRAGRSAPPVGAAAPEPASGAPARELRAPAPASAGRARTRSRSAASPWRPSRRSPPDLAPPPALGRRSPRAALRAARWSPPGDRAPEPVPAAEASAGAAPAERAATATLGEIYLRQGHLGEAKRIFDEVLRREPDNAAALEGLAQLASRRGGAAAARRAAICSPATSRARRGGDGGEGPQGLPSQQLSEAPAAGGPARCFLSS